MVVNILPKTGTELNELKRDLAHVGVDPTYRSHSSTRR
jgi:hypothetical protein